MMVTFFNYINLYSNISVGKEGRSELPVIQIINQPGILMCPPSGKCFVFYRRITVYNERNLSTEACCTCENFEGREHV